MNLQITLLLWCVIGAALGALLGRLVLGGRPRDWAPALFLGSFGAAIVGFIVRSALAAAVVPFADQASLASAVLGGALGAGSFVLAERIAKARRAG